MCKCTVVPVRFTGMYMHTRAHECNHAHVCTCPSFRMYLSAQNHVHAYTYHLWACASSSKHLKATTIYVFIFIHWLAYVHMHTGTYVHAWVRVSVHLCKYMSTLIVYTCARALICACIKAHNNICVSMHPCIHAFP